MGRLFSRESDAAVDRSETPRVVCLDDDHAGEILGALQSETAQAAFRAVHREPMAAAELATELDISVQTVGYHIEKLRDANLIEHHETVYSEKGREMAVYGPATEPKLLFFGTSDDQQALESVFTEYASALGIGAVVLAVRGALSPLKSLLDWL
ncbi:ArsR family transcriptional regulator [Halovivax asiaticus JCM 14624]|uniref:ArsR family transcriptional regulator n=1 Tax=Halovivax asiaticus JCM 14624 TaxID=1227490 RepID=M0BN55_9EURY|nr:helix-turn-helix domain-containing protein [Halovivax asiaticus]ELZ11019.1 ArsR family transcriptional regulator [Halovivax asiaticus JCM 14624]